MGKIVGFCVKESGQYSVVRSRWLRPGFLGEKFLSISILSIASGPPSALPVSRRGLLPSDLCCPPQQTTPFFSKEGLSRTFFWVFQNTHSAPHHILLAVFASCMQRTYGLQRAINLPSDKGLSLILGFCDARNGRDKIARERKKKNRVSATSDRNIKHAPLQQEAILKHSEFRSLQLAVCPPDRRTRYLSPRHNRASEIQEIARSWLPVSATPTTFFSNYFSLARAARLQ